LVLFVADHGVVEDGVSIWPASVTTAMIRTILRERSASVVLAHQHSTDWRLVDVGSLALPEITSPRYQVCKVRSASRNLGREPALSVQEFHQAWAIGTAQADDAAAAGMRLLLVGEMGIGNTTPSSCLAALLANVPLELAVGRGAGADDAVLQRKRTVVSLALERARRMNDPIEAIASVAGLEIVAMAGLFAQAAKRKLPVILDGFVTTAAALIAEQLVAGTTENMIAAHRSAEPGHLAMLEHLGLSPALSDWGMRLGEGTGALLLLPMLDAVAALLGEMATIDEVMAY
jgi:nicotinate-nucleotide--dimethylbenzimidazole phosphoribosyltransferase